MYSLIDFFFFNYVIIFLTYNQYINFSTLTFYLKMGFLVFALLHLIDYKLNLEVDINNHVYFFFASFHSEVVCILRLVFK